MKHSWQKLTKEDIRPLLSKIQVEEFKELFKPDSQMEVLRAPLPFYKNHFLYKFITLATMPSLSLEFLSDGETFYFLDGAPDPLYYVNGVEELQLTESTVLDYLLFFFDAVNGTEGEIFLIEDPLDSPFMSSVSDEFKRNVTEQYKGFQLRFDEASSRFVVKAPTFFEGSMIEAVVSIAPDGSLELLEHKMLFSIMGGGTMEWSSTEWS